MGGGDHLVMLAHAVVVDAKARLSGQGAGGATVSQDKEPSSTMPKLQLAWSQVRQGMMNCLLAYTFSLLSLFHFLVNVSETLNKIKKNSCRVYKEQNLHLYLLHHLDNNTFLLISLLDIFSI